MKTIFKGFEALAQQKEFLIAIDSDGCAINTMNIKHKNILIPLFIDFFHLEDIAQEARESWEFLNLYSKNRACNRFKGLSLTLGLLGSRRDLQNKGYQLPAFEDIHHWVQNTPAPSQELLAQAITKSGSKELEIMLAWSQAVEEVSDAKEQEFHVFDFVRESLEKLSSRGTCFVVSTSGYQRLEKEWAAHGIDSYIKLIIGREMGEKEINLKKGAGNNFDKNKCLMIGDSPGDLKAAKGAGYQFYPIIPDKENESWELLYNQVIDSFWQGQYKSRFEGNLINQFQKSFLSQPPWEA